MSNAPSKLAPIRQLVAQGKFDAARSQLARMIQRAPADHELCAAMAVVLDRLGQAEQARFYADRAAAAVKDDPARLIALAEQFLHDGRVEDAHAAYARAAERRPTELSAQLPLLNFLYASGRLVDAAERARAAVAGCPGAPEPRLMLAFALMSLGRAAEADAALAEAQAAFPSELRIATARAANSNYLLDADPRAVFELHRAYGRMLERLMPVPPAPPAFAVSPDPERRLRIAFISPDYRTHSIAFFLESLLRHLDREAFEPVCISTLRVEDATTARLRSIVGAAGWKDADGLSERPAQFAELLRRERIDIAVEISGHSYRHALAALHLRGAPVQATYMGYPNTTGVSAIDVRVVDSLTDPPPRPLASGADTLATERLVRIDPCFLCYTPPREAPAVVERPSEPRGITFGSFNNLAKINDAAIAAWARIIQRTPGSRLVVKNLALADRRVRDEAAARFARAGFPMDRLDLIAPAQDVGGHLSVYGRIDIALDTFPYNGTTTTCEAMYMGVPVVSLAGRTHASRVGLSLLSAIGIPELVGADADAYVDIAAGLAADPARLAGMRSSLRSRLLASPLCDGPGHARRFGDAMREAWRAWCRGGGTYPARSDHA